MSALAWCPTKLRTVFEPACLGDRCIAKHPPRLVRVGDDAWIAACGWTGPSHPEWAPSVLYRLGRWSNERAKSLEVHPIGLHVAAAISRAVPCPIDPSVLCRHRDLDVARLLGVDRWGLTRTGKVPALVGFDGAFAPSLARALVAPNDTPAAKYASEIETVLRVAQ